MAVGKLKRISGSIPMESLRGPAGLPGNDGVNGTDGIGLDGKDGRDGKDGVGLTGEKGRDGVDGRDGQDGSTPQHEVRNGEIRFMLANGEWGAWIMMSSGGGGQTLSLGQEDVLAHIRYDPTLNRLITDVSLETILASYYLGDMHKLTSAGYGVFTTNLASNTSYLPVMTGVKDHAIAANRTASGIIPAHSRVYGDYLAFELNGSVTSNDVLYSFTRDIPQDVSAFGIEIEPSEAIEPTDVLDYHLHIGTDENGRIAYSQTLTGITVAKGSTLSWYFDHPVDLKTEAVDVFFDLRKNGVLLSVKAGTDRPDKPWVIARVRSFEDKYVSLLDDREAETGKTEWVMGELLTNSIHWSDGQVICWPSTVTGAESLGDYINWADS